MIEANSLKVLPIADNRPKGLRTTRAVKLNGWFGDADRLSNKAQSKSKPDVRTIQPYKCKLKHQRKAGGNMPTGIPASEERARRAGRPILSSAIMLSDAADAITEAAEKAAAKKSKK